MRTAPVAASWGLTALLGLACLAAPALAQGQPQVTPDTVPAGQAQAKAAAATCDRLISYLQETRPAGAVTTDQARTWLQASDALSCQRELDRLTEAGRATPGGGTVQAGQAAGNSGQPAGAIPPQPPQGQTTGAQPGYGTSPTAESTARTGGSPGAAAPQTTGALPAASMTSLQVSRIADMTLYTAREEKLGEVDAVVSDPGGRQFVVVSHGGFLGLGERRVTIPLEALAMRENRLVADTLSDEELKRLPEFDRSGGYREVEGSQNAQIRLVR